ncbi:MAG: pirin family protein, partial [Planctomycetes bacterium]|nr:pirin family protein [Planctomycetota bacterium]
FSFANYFDRAHMGFGRMRVLNEDRIAGGSGFGTHPHDNMEIVTIILDGELEHRDSKGHGSTIKRYDVQRMSAGSGIAHSEYNPSQHETHLFQVWFRPDQRDIDPSYEEKSFLPEEREDRLALLVHPEGKDGSLKIFADVEIYASDLSEGKTLEHRPAPERQQWLQVASGSLDVNGQTVNAGDGAGIEGEAALTFKALAPHTEFVLFDMG